MELTDILENRAADAPVNGATSTAVINLDANANTPVGAAVLAAIVQSLEGATNPSSAHRGGERARQLLAKSRDAVASLADGVFDDGVIFTSGCTEANNTVLEAAPLLGATIVTTRVEHASVLSPVAVLENRGTKVVYLDVDGCGVIDLDGLEAVIGGIDGPILLSVQAANSETGVRQPIDVIASMIAHRLDVLFHSDAAQAFGKSTMRLGRGIGPDVATISGHKLHGPMGVGAMLLATDEDRILALLHGGGQQGGMRAGTEPLPLIAGLGAACVERERRLAADIATMTSLTFRLENGILDACAGSVVNGAGAHRLPNTSNFRFPGIDAMALVARLDDAGVMISHGSACSSMRPTPSHTLLAMGLNEEQAFSSVRFSTSPLNTPDEIEDAVALVTGIVERLRAGR